MVEDNFRHSVANLTASSDHCFAISPSDNNELSYATKAIYIGRSGDVRLIPLRSETPVIFRNLLAGTLLDVRVRAVMATGTTAEDLVGLA